MAWLDGIVSPFHDVCYKPIMTIIATYFRRKAKLLQELADALGDHNGDVVIQLRALAVEFDAGADALDAQMKKEMAADSLSDDGPQFH